MNLKPIELQIALPRSADAANLQQQSNQKQAVDHMHVMQAQVKQSEETQKKPAKPSETEEAHIKERQNGSGEQEQGNRRGNKQPSNGNGQTNEAVHPYKGHHIDVSL